MKRMRLITKSFVPGGVYDPKVSNTTNNANNGSLEQSQQMLQLEQQQQELQELQQAIDAKNDESQEGENNTAYEDVDDSVTTDNGKPQFKKIFAKRKKSSVRAKEKKIRQNRQLRKAIMPKNALMALHEVKGINISDFLVNNNDEGGFTAIVVVNNCQYEGRGKSKIAAKSNACEKALRDFVIAKMYKKPRLAKNQPETIEYMDTSETTEQVESDGEKAEKTVEDNDDLPMINLASFALFKLFSEWESEGYVIPEMHPSTPNIIDIGIDTAPKEPKKPPVRNELPANWETMHPATLLCMMRPGTTYITTGIEGDKINAQQVLSVIVDDQEFTGKGRSKKIARRNAAAVACNGLFATNFLIDEATA